MVAAQIIFPAKVMLDPWICRSICIESYNSLTVKAAKASINVSKVSYKSRTHPWYDKKEKYLCKISMFTFKSFSARLT